MPDTNYSQLTGVYNEIRRVIIGKDEVIRQVLMAILAKGHILLEDIPGVGKTTLAVGLAKSLGLSYNRMQFTPDVMPSDLTGYHMYDKGLNEECFFEGALMCNLLLADEINRTSPKTQAALLEAMEESCVTVDAETIPLPDPFIVIATENPFGSAGTQKLPESQLDRFMIRTSIGYPELDDEISIMKKEQNLELHAILNAEDLAAMQIQVHAIEVDDSVYDYIARLAKATRNDAMIDQGISPRGSISLLSMAKACAYLNERNFCIPDDVKEVFSSVVAHRLIMKTGFAAETAINRILKDTPAPRAGRR
jgi:MoxR-like ATPase